MLRVLVDGVIYGLQRYGGISNCFTETLSRLGFHCDDIEVIVYISENPQAKTPRAKWIREIVDRKLRPQMIFGHICKEASKIRVRMLRPQIFHSTYYTSPSWLGMRTVVTVHDFIDEKFPALRGNPTSLSDQKRRAVESADAIVAVSNCVKNDILRYTKTEESRIVVIHHGVSDAFLVAAPSEKAISRFREAHGIGNPYWLYVGNRGLYKNFGTLLRAFVRIAPQTGGYLVTVGGEHRLEPWQVDLLIKNRLEKKVCLLSAISDSNLQIAYSGATAFVFPSLAEGFGIPLLEAMACGTPVIASDVPTFREVAAVAALYFHPHAEEELAHVMTSVLEESVRMRLVEAGHKQVGNFSWDIAAQKLGDVYRSLA
ncbi:glycosyltransferase family 4 protein [Thermodesulfobacteriota bacterium]